MSATKHTKLESAVADPVTGEEVTFRRSTKPGALVEVTLADRKINVRFDAMHAAIRLMQLEGEE